MSAFENDAVVCDVLDGLAVNLDGTQAAPEYFSRRRRVLHRVLGYAVRKQRLETNPLSKGNLPDSWTPRRHQTTPSTRDVSEVQPSSRTCSPRVATSGAARDRGSSRSTAACTTR